MSATFYANSRDLLLSLHRKVAALQASPLNPDLAFDCAVRAWALCDWVHKEFGAQLGFASGRNGLRDLQNVVKREREELVFLQDVANGSKHMTITDYPPQINEAKVHKGVFDPNVFSSAFDIARLVLVERATQKTHSFQDVAVAAAKYWDDFFTKHNLP